VAELLLLLDTTERLMALDRWIREELLPRVSPPPHTSWSATTSGSILPSVCSSAGCRSPHRGPKRHQIFHVMTLARPPGTRSTQIIPRVDSMLTI
jgi:hypothetical protein